MLESTLPPYADPIAVERPAFRPLPPLVAEEPRGVRLMSAALAGLFAVAYFLFILQYWAPAHPGVDQNGYLVGGKMLAWHGTTGFKPDGLQYVGNMFVRNTATDMVYPKYPVGLPLLYAVALWTCGTLGPKAAFLVSPIGAAAAVLGVYFLTRRFAGTFASLMAMLLLAFGQVLLVLADNPNSHASCLAFVVWGVFLLIGFWETGSAWRGLLAGFLLGFAVTIRYTEGLLGLLIAVAVIGSIVYRNRRGYLRSLTPVIGWLVPVAALVIFNVVAMGTPTGYDTTNESKPGAAFTTEHVGENWDKVTRQLHDTGLFFVLPLGLLGMGLALRDTPRRGLLLWLWFVPGVAVYASYYWAPDRGVSYLRFFLTLMPPVVVGAGVLIDRVVTTSVTRWQRVVAPAACGLVVLIACSNSLYRGLLGVEEGQETGQGMEGLFRQTVNLSGLSDVVLHAVPAGSTVIAPPAQLNHLQFAGDYTIYSTEAFTTAYATRLRGQSERMKPDDPDPLQPALRDWYLKQVDGKTDEQLAQTQIDTVKKALDGGRRAFLVCRSDQVQAFTRRYERRGSGLKWKAVAFYNELPRLRAPDDGSTDSSADLMPKPDRGTNNGPRANAANPPRPAGGFFGRRGGGNAAFRTTEPRPAAWRVIEITKAQA